MPTEDMFDDAHEPATKGDLRGLSVRLDGHDRRFDAVEGNLRRLNIGFARMEGDMSEMKGKMDVLLTLKDEFSQFKSDIERMTHFLKKLESRPQ